MTISRKSLSAGCGSRLTLWFSLLLISACSADNSAEKAPVRVAVQQVISAEVKIQMVLTGDIRARKVTDQAFRVSGKLVERRVDVGDRVRAGQVLARLDPREQQTELELANAEVTARESQLLLAQANYRRQQILLPKGYTNLSEHQKARAALESALGDLAAYKAQQASARDRLGYTELLAVADGVITARHAEEGQVVQAATPVFSVAHDGQREAVFAAYEALLDSDPLGRLVQVRTLSTPETELPGKIREVTPIVSSISGTQLVRVTLPESASALALGTVVSAQLDLAARKAFTLPWSALTRVQGQPAVWLLDDKARARLARVQVLRYEQGQVLIESGLSDGDLVVSKGLQFLHPGQVVGVAERTPQTSAVTLAAGPKP